jgi:hypothetical protein
MNRKYVSFFARHTLAAVVTFSALLIPSTASANEQNTKPLQVCQNEDGSPKQGPIDIVLLLDNSKSLNTTRSAQKPTDPENNRFDAIEDLLGALSEVSQDTETQKGVNINFGLVSFGSKAIEQIPLQKLGSPKDVTAEIKKKVPVSKQEQDTNYVVALKKALSIFEGRPNENCKMLVWFTDGQFESSEISRYDPARTRKIREQAENLKREMCGPDGIASRFHQLRINTFVLVLKPSTSGIRLEASYGAMQAITGATVVPPGVKSDSDMCGNPAERDHLGEILVAEDAASIARKIPTIGNTIDGWTPATVCPVSSAESDMPKMPAARHLESISFTAYEKPTEIANLEKSRIIDSQGREHTFSKFLVPMKSRSVFEKRYKFKKDGELELNQGWTFSIESGERGWCVQVLHRRFTVEFTDDDSEPVREVSKVPRLTSDDIKSLKFQTEVDSVLLSLSDARNSTNKVVGLLDIDPTEVMFKTPIQVGVNQRNVPSVSCDMFVFSESGADMPKDRALMSSCIINTSNSSLGDVVITAVSGQGLRRDECKATLLLATTEVGQDWTLEVPTSAMLTHPKGVANLHAVLKFEGREAKCASVGKSTVQFVFGVPKQSLEVPVTINVELKKVPKVWIVLLVSLVLLLLVVLSNLLLMRWLMSKSAKISRAGIDAYEVPVLIRKGSDGRLEIRLADGSAPMTHVFEVTSKIALRVNDDGRSATLNGGTRSKLKVVLPALYQPFGDALIVIDSPKAALYWQQPMNRRGLQPHIKAGVIIHSPIRNGETVQATATFLLPSQGLERQMFIRDALGSRISMALQDLLAEPDWFAGDVSSQGSGPSRPSAGSPSVSGTPSGAQPNNDSDTGPTRRPPPPPPPRR